MSPVLSPDVESEQIDFIDSCAGEEEEEEGRRSRGGATAAAAAAAGGGGGDGTSLSSQFMAYIERRITREVVFRIERLRWAHCVLSASSQ